MSFPRFGNRLFIELVPSAAPAAANAGLLRDQHLERQRGERARRHDEELLALDQILKLTEQRLIKRMCAGEVEGQLALIREALAEQLLAGWLTGRGYARKAARAFPWARIEAAAKRLRLAGERRRAQIRAHPYPSWSRPR